MNRRHVNQILQMPVCKPNKFEYSVTAFLTNLFPTPNCLFHYETGFFVCLLLRLSVRLRSDAICKQMRCSVTAFLTNLFPAPNCLFLYETGFFVCLLLLPWGRCQIWQADVKNLFKTKSTGVFPCFFL